MVPRSLQLIGAALIRANDFLHVLLRFRPAVLTRMGGCGLQKEAFPMFAFFPRRYRVTPAYRPVYRMIGYAAQGFLAVLVIYVLLVLILVI